LKLRKLFVTELAIVIIVLIAVVVVVEVNPALAGSSQSAPIGVFNSKIYAADTVLIAKGESFSTSFDYSSYEPAILVIDVHFSDIQSAGTLNLMCNGRYLGSVYGSPDNPQASLSAISVSGSEWIKPPSAYSSSFSNQIIFASDSDQGFAGTFNYQVTLKGSR
jgi:hypothetical protein